VNDEAPVAAIPVSLAPGHHLNLAARDHTGGSVLYRDEPIFKVFCAVIGYQNIVVVVVRMGAERM
jgi:hypothetical protein